MDTLRHTLFLLPPSSLQRLTIQLKSTRVMSENQPTTPPEWETTQPIDVEATPRTSGRAMSTICQDMREISFYDPIRAPTPAQQRARSQALSPTPPSRRPRSRSSISAHSSSSGEETEYDDIEDPEETGKGELHGPAMPGTCIPKKTAESSKSGPQRSPSHASELEYASDAPIDLFVPLFADGPTPSPLHTPFVANLSVVKGPLPFPVTRTQLDQVQDDIQHLQATIQAATHDITSREDFSCHMDNVATGTTTLFPNNNIVGDANVLRTRGQSEGAQKYTKDLPRTPEKE